MEGMPLWQTSDAWVAVHDGALKPQAIEEVEAHLNELQHNYADVLEPGSVMTEIWRAARHNELHAEINDLYMKLLGSRNVEVDLSLTTDRERALIKIAFLWMAIEVHRCDDAYVAPDEEDMH